MSETDNIVASWYKANGLVIRKAAEVAEMEVLQRQRRLEARSATVLRLGELGAGTAMQASSDDRFADYKADLKVAYLGLHNEGLSSYTQTSTSKLNWAKNVNLLLLGTEFADLVTNLLGVKAGATVGDLRTELHAMETSLLDIALPNYKFSHDWWLKNTPEDAKREIQFGPGPDVPYGEGNLRKALTYLVNIGLEPLVLLKLILDKCTGIKDATKLLASDNIDWGAIQLQDLTKHDRNAMYVDCGSRSTKCYVYKGSGSDVIEKIKLNLRFQDCLSDETADKCKFFIEEVLRTAEEHGVDPTTCGRIQLGATQVDGVDRNSAAKMHEQQTMFQRTLSNMDTNENVTFKIITPMEEAIFERRAAIQQLTTGEDPNVAVFTCGGKSSQLSWGVTKEEMVSFVLTRPEYTVKNNEAGHPRIRKKTHAASLPQATTFFPSKDDVRNAHVFYSGAGN